MANITHTVNMSIVDKGGTITGTTVDTGTNLQFIDAVLEDPTSDTPVACAFILANVQALDFICDADAEVGFVWSGGTQVFPLCAGAPLSWSCSTGYYANPIQHDTTSLSVSCPTGGRLQGRVLVR